MKKIYYLTLLLIFTSSVLAKNTSSESVLQRRIFMLESALAPTTPKEVVTKWARAVSNRNGAVQYMLLCPNLQEKYLRTLENLNWVTGVSSPRISNFNVQQQTSSQQYNIQYQMSLQKTPAGVVKDTIVVQKAAEPNSSQQWCISQFKYLSPTSVKPQ